MSLTSEYAEMRYTNTDPYKDQLSHTFGNTSRKRIMSRMQELVNWLNVVEYEKPVARPKSMKARTERIAKELSRALTLVNNNFAAQFDLTQVGSYGAHLPEVESSVQVTAGYLRHIRWMTVLVDNLSKFRYGSQDLLKHADDTL